MATTVRPNVQRMFGELAERVGIPPQAAQELEVGVYNWTIRYAKAHNVTRSWGEHLFGKLYTEKARQVLSNLDGKSYVANTRLVERLQNGEFEAASLAFMPPDRLFPELWKDSVEALSMREEKALKPKVVPKTDRFHCRMCKQNECSFYEMQIRSGDEASTLFILCLNCGHKWRING